MRFVLGIFIALFLFFPFVILLVHVVPSQAPVLRVLMEANTVEVFAFTFAQAALSAVGALALGIPGALGLMWIAGRAERGKMIMMMRRSDRIRRLVEVVVLAPNVAPVLLLLLATMRIFPFVRGLFGIVVVHALLNAGLVAVAFAGLVRDKIGGMAELAWVEGASGPRFFFRGVLPCLRRDLAMIFLFVFAVCFSSFAVPLAIGGSRATTIEVLIFEKIRLESDWAAALGLAFLQMSTVVGLSLLQRGRFSGVSSFSLETPLVTRVVSTPLLSWKWGLVPVLLPSFVLVTGLADGVAAGLRQMSGLELLMRELPGLALGSFFVAMGTGVMSIVFLLALAYVDPRGLTRRWLLGYVAPSSVLTGFALLIAWRATGFATYVKLIIAISLVTVPAFHRLRWDAMLRALDGQRTVARILGASDRLIFARIVFPQVIRQAFVIGGLAALWAWGDFALSSVIAERTMTLAMLVRGLMESYRLDAAAVLTCALSAAGGLMFIAFVGVGNVFVLWVRDMKREGF